MYLTHKNMPGAKWEKIPYVRIKNLLLLCSCNGFWASDTCAADLQSETAVKN